MTDGWRQMIPKVKGSLPLEGILYRTEPSGESAAQVTIVGVYPAAIKWKTFRELGEEIYLPTMTERISFDPQSKSGRQLEDLYLWPLELPRRQVYAFDLWPFFMANTAKDRYSGQSMADNIARYEKLKSVSLGIEARPTPEKLISRCRLEPYRSRLEELLGGCQARLLVTLGVEPAAFVRGATLAAARKLLYQDAQQLKCMGFQGLAVHLAHPGVLIRDPKGALALKHKRWCRETGRTLIAEVLSKKSC